MEMRPTTRRSSSEIACDGFLTVFSLSARTYLRREFSCIHVLCPFEDVAKSKYVPYAELWHAVKQASQFVRRITQLRH